jgi:hypothetical protein
VVLESTEKIPKAANKTISKKYLTNYVICSKIGTSTGERK